MVPYVTLATLLRDALSATDLQRPDDLFGESLPLPEVLAAIVVVLFDQVAVFVASPLPLVHLSRLQIVGVVHSRNRCGDLIAEVRVLLPLNRPLGDSLDDRR